MQTMAWNDTHQPGNHSYLGCKTSIEKGLKEIFSLTGILVFGLFVCFLTMSVVDIRMSKPVEHFYESLFEPH